MDDCKHEIVYIEYGVTHLLPEHFHVTSPVGNGYQPGGQSAHKEQIEIIEREDAQETPAIKFYEVIPGGKDFLHVEKNAGDQKTRKDKEKLYSDPAHLQIMGMEKEDEQKCNRAQSVESGNHWGN